MSFSDWLILGTAGWALKKTAKRIEEKSMENIFNYVENIDKAERKMENMRKTYERNNIVDTQRENTPCKFEDGISYTEFSEIVHKHTDSIRRIKELKISGAKINGRILSQTGCSDWGFEIDFNDWGHITGTRWTSKENDDSDIPNYIGENIANDIKKIIEERKIKLFKYSDFVDENKAIGTAHQFVYQPKYGFWEKRKIRKKMIKIECTLDDLRGEHVCFVISYMKKIGFCNISATPIKDIDKKSEKFLFEVEEIRINGKNILDDNEIVPKDSEIIISYHDKRKIKTKYAHTYYRKKNVDVIKNEFENLGFSNIELRKIKDLVLGKLVKDGSIENVFVVEDGNNVPIIKDKYYKYDEKIIIEYHTFK